MKMFCLWLVNQLFGLTVIVFFLGFMTLGSVLGPNPDFGGPMNAQTRTIILIIAAVVGLIPAIFTAKFAKDNFDEMLSSGFIRWTSTLRLWESEWKFFFKTLFLGWLCYGSIVFFLELIICVWLGWI